MATNYNLTALIARIDAATLPISIEPDEIEATIEGIAEDLDGAFAGTIRLMPGVGIVRVVVAAADAGNLRRIDLDDGRVAFEYEPEQDEGVVVSIGVGCPLCAVDLVDAFDHAADELHAILPDEVVEPGRAVAAA